jgi:exonuclease SbcC
MKINAIRIKNLASLEGLTEIDFTAEPLASAGIFAITGPTGAGKSTVLDALCLALYGKTPRYLQAKEMGIEIHDVQGTTMSQGDVRGILRDGTSDGFAEVDFMGIDGQNYRANWSVRRARNKAEGSLQADQITLKNISNRIDLPGKKAETLKEIERLVGLNFEQFTRSVLLAQGDFTAFMKANKDEKSSLLEKLTGTHIYSEISKKIFEKCRNEENILRELHIRRDGISVLSESEMSELKEQEIGLTAQIEHLKKEIVLLSNEINWHKQLEIFSKTKEEAYTYLQNANKAILESESRKNHLFQVEQAQTSRSWYDALQNNQKQLAEQNTSLVSLTESISSLLSQKEQLTHQLKKEELHWAKAVDWQKEALPKLTEAKKLDTLIAEKIKQSDLAKTELETAKIKQTNFLKEVSEKEVELVQIAKKIQSAQEWQNKLEAKKPIAIHQDIIISKLNDAEKLRLSLQNASLDKNNVAETIKTTSETLKSRLEALELLEKDWKRQHKNVEEQSKALILISIERLNVEKNEIDILFQNTLEAQAIWNSLHPLTAEFDFLCKKQSKDQSDYMLKNEQLLELEKALEHALLAKETSEQMVQKARLSVTEHVETLREQLIENEPCIVCGSKNHPYTLHNPQLEKVWSSLEKSHQQNEKMYLQTFGTKSSLEQEIKTLIDQMSRQATEIDAKKLLLKTKQQAWELHSISKEIEPISHEQKSAWLEQKLRNLKTNQVQLLEQIKAHSDLKSKLDAAKLQLEKAKEKKDICETESQELRSQLAVFSAKMDGIDNTISQTQLDLTALKNSLQDYFESPDWWQKWNEKPQDFVASIRSFSAEWKTKSEQLALDLNKSTTLISVLEQLKNQEKNILDDLAQKTTSAAILEKDLAEKTIARKAIFEGQPADLMEQKLANDVSEAKNNVENITHQVNQNAVREATLEAQKTATVTSIAKLALEIANANAKIEQWLQLFHQKTQQTITITGLQTLLTYSLEWMESERKMVREIADEQTKAATIFEERTQILAEHTAKKPSERPLEELTALHQNAQIENENFAQAKANIGFKIAENERNKLKIGALLDAIALQATIADNWSKLNDVIGSADGKKFRQIAQEYTLEVLLSYANIHLKDLTSRYKIERIPNTLGLQVVDLDMGDEIRTVYSLSGGESFLVSLALALGLASLSSSKMKVESLFIDEGFGSLDPNTLNIAMDALERLHNQGRKVGVISHVHEMTERIPVQIKVSKKSSGRSLVEVVGY